MSYRIVCVQNFNFNFDPSNTFIRFSVQNGSGRPIDHMVIIRCMASADLFCTERVDASWFLVKGLLVMRSSSKQCIDNTLTILLPNSDIVMYIVSASEHNLSLLPLSQ